MKYDNYIKLEFPSLSCNEALARSVVGAFAAQLDPTMDELGDIKTAVSEAVTNCVVHAYPESIGSILEITVRDWGRGIEDVDRARTPLFTTGGDDRSGMGFTIMESFMEKLTVRSRPGDGTTVTMTRMLPRRRRER